MKIPHWIPASVAHEMAPWALGLYADWMRSKTELQSFAWNSFSWRDLHFRNPAGIAGGVDKTGSSLESWQSLGAGFLEAGTITPYAQKANPGKIMARDESTQSLWNKMGFPNEGSAQFAAEIQNLDLQVPLFINIGKNRQTPLENSSEDYAHCAAVLRDFADTFVLNISSPNTSGLRELQRSAALKDIVRHVQKEASQLPLLLKLSPDLSDSELIATLDASLEAGIDGFILTNTTSLRLSHSPFPIDGGVSGKPLLELSRKALKLTAEHLQKTGTTEVLLVSVGGISSLAEVKHRMELGAHLVQIYSAFAFEGPGLFWRFAQEAQS